MIYTDDVREKCARLYKQGLPIKEIMQRTGLKSTQTVYRMLEESKVEIKSMKGGGRKVIAISLDDDTRKILEIKNPRNISSFVCRAVKGYHRKVLTKCFTNVSQKQQKSL